MGKDNIRSLIVDTLLKTEREGIFLSEAEKETLRTHRELSAADRAFYKKITDGTIEQRIRIDYILDLFSSTKSSRMKPYIRQLLRMSVYQLIWMDAVPDSAVCNEAVKLAASHGYAGLKGFVNGVLRNISRGKTEIAYPDGQDIARYLSVYYSCPEWIVRDWIERFGEEHATLMLRASVAGHPLSIRLRTRDSGSAAAYEEAWREAGIEFEPNPYIPGAYYMDRTGDVEQIPGFEDGSIVVQDTGSMMVSLLGIDTGESVVLDLCAAPGGKSIHAADLLCKPHVLARDLSQRRCELIRENIRRLHLEDVIDVGCADATVYDPDMADRADTVILDAPCSGLGVIGHKPDIKYRITPEDTDQLSGLQRSIIDNAVRYVRPGGRLVYSTCTTSRSEGTDQAAYICDRYGFTDITSACISDLYHEGGPDFFREGFGAYLLPGLNRSDGFFIAVLLKES